MPHFNTTNLFWKNDLFKLFNSIILGKQAELGSVRYTSEYNVIQWCRQVLLTLWKNMAQKHTHTHTHITCRHSHEQCACFLPCDGYFYPANPTVLSAQIFQAPAVRPRTEIQTINVRHETISQMNTLRAGDWVNLTFHISSPYSFKPRSEGVTKSLKVTRERRIR